MRETAALACSIPSGASGSSIWLLLFLIKLCEAVPDKVDLYHTSIS